MLNHLRRATRSLPPLKIAEPQRRSEAFAALQKRASSAWAARALGVGGVVAAAASLIALGSARSSAAQSAQAWRGAQGSIQALTVRNAQLQQRWWTAEAERRRAAAALAAAPRAAEPDAATKAANGLPPDVAAAIDKLRRPALGYVAFEPRNFSWGHLTGAAFFQKIADYTPVEPRSWIKWSVAQLDAPYPAAPPCNGDGWVPNPKLDGGTLTIRGEQALTDDEFSRVQNGVATIRMVGALCYKDPIGWEHRTDFCAYLNPNSGWQDCDRIAPPT